MNNTLIKYNPKLSLGGFKNPTSKILAEHVNEDVTMPDEFEAIAQDIVDVLETFGVELTYEMHSVGASVTTYEFSPKMGSRISKIKNLEDEIAMHVGVSGVRVIAPMKGKRTIGVEVPNLTPTTVGLKDVIDNIDVSKMELPVVMGEDSMGQPFAFDLAKMPHLLMAGATGQGKSVGINVMLTSLLMTKHPSELKLVLIDPKKVELNMYNNIDKHYLAMAEGMSEPVISDMSEAVLALKALTEEMDKRYTLLKGGQVRNIIEYNTKFVNRELDPDEGHFYMPYIVVVIDEFADLMMTADKEVEPLVARIAQLARAVGIHLVIATQRPSTNVITGVIKANFPARMSFRVATKIDSRTILDASGAESLVGRGDMLFKVGVDMTRVQSAFITNEETINLLNIIEGQDGYETPYKLPHK